MLRAQGNRSGRGRMRPDGSLQLTKPPRGLILSTGEDIPSGQSLRARMCIAEISPGDVDLPRLTACQSDAGSGRLAAALAGFVRWLAPQMSGLHADLHTQVVAIRGHSQRAALNTGELRGLPQSWRSGGGTSLALPHPYRRSPMRSATLFGLGYGEPFSPSPSSRANTSSRLIRQTGFVRCWSRRWQAASHMLRGQMGASRSNQRHGDGGSRTGLTPYGSLVERNSVGLSMTISTLIARPHSEWCNALPETSATPSQYQLAHSRSGFTNAAS